MPTISSLQTWDWRWRAPFDEAVDAQVRSGIDQLQQLGYLPHAQLLAALREHAHDVASIGGLLASLEEEDDPLRREAILTKASALELNGVPAFLAEGAFRRIEARGTSPHEVEVLQSVLSRALRSSWKDPHSGALEIVFGDDLAHVVGFGQRLRRKVGEARGFGRRVDPSEVPRLVEEFLGARPELSGRLAAFDTSVAPGQGFGAYWPKELRGRSRDELAIDANPDSLRSLVLQETLAHELGGHGVFYELIRRTTPPFVDHGALALIEGWATFAEWCLPGMPGPDETRLRFLDVIGAEPEDLRSAIPSIVRAQGYSTSQAETALFNWTQLPAYQLSYLLGGLWFAVQADTFEKGLEFLRRIMAQPVGDFLTLY
jgi:hypothetical protein